MEWPGLWAGPLLSWKEVPDGRVLEVPQTGMRDRVGFSALGVELTGVAFTNELKGDLSLTNAVAHNGSGVAVGDVDGDGWPDIYLCGLQSPNRLYRNLGGWRFEDMELGEAACAAQLSTGAAFADVDGDGALDLLVNGIGTGTRLFLNDGKGGWREVLESGLSRSASATSMALGDIDGDGDLDLYVAHYIDVMHLADPTTRFALARDGGQWRITKINGESANRPYWKDRFEVLADGRVRELPEADALYVNEGGGRFRRQLTPEGFVDAQGNPVGPYRDWGLSVMFRDLNGDGAPEIYVCNDNASPDRFWINDGRGRFRVADPWVFRHSTRSSMALDFADVDRDGHDDLFVLDMLAREHRRRMRQLVRDYPDPADNERSEQVVRYNRNMLYFGRADGTYAEVALMAGVAATDWSWCPIFLDVDLDGYEDLLVANGFEFDVMDQDSVDAIRGMKLTFDQRKRFRQFHPDWPTKNVALRNQRDGTFQERSESWGFDLAGVSCGMALGDFDNDGDMDVVVNNLNAAASLYRNDATGGRVAVRLVGTAPNTQGIGARVRLVGGAVIQSQEMISGGRYMSGDQALRVFAADRDASTPIHVEVRWRNGDLTRVEVRPDTICEVKQLAGTSTQTARVTVAKETPWFVDVSNMINHQHVEDALDDWTIQPLLPRRLSRLGPGVAWHDINADGWDDLVVAAADGSPLALFLNQQGRSFVQVQSTRTAPGDLGAVVGFSDAVGQRRILAARSHFGAGTGATSGIEIHALADASGTVKLEKQMELTAGDVSPGPMAMGDVDGDGDLDLFVGGRFRPGRYPEAVRSAIWLQENGALHPGEDFGSPGLVSGAAFGDLDGDGWVDLVLAVEWGPVRVYQNRSGQFKEVTESWGLADRRGWWTGVAMGDFNNDGLLDLAVGNWGRNSIYDLNRPDALRLFFVPGNQGDLLQLVEAWRGNGDWFPVRPRPWLERAFPDLPNRVSTHEAYGRATVAEIWGTSVDSLGFVEATHFESGIFLNRGGTFEFLPLPSVAQRTPAFGVAVGDYDGDGSEDLFLSQNFFGGGSDLTREDGGRGLWLRGRGDGTFEEVETGINVVGEQRGAALADFDGDGRVDLVVAQNNGATKLYRNERGRRGLRVRLKGPPGNSDGVGVQLRLKYQSGRVGPVRVVQSGSGYWSQSSAVMVLGMAEPVRTVEVLWPGGRKQLMDVKEGLWELQVSYEDEAK